VYRLSRLDYDIAVGVSGSAAKDAAMSEMSKPTEPMPYNNSDEFAVSFAVLFSSFICLNHGTWPRYTLPVFTGRVDGPCSRVLWIGARDHGP